ncbi:MAG: hypothetical protein NTZ67_04500 [Gammaproteobacteria bacterium]|nr:hypothetical protein [Gammaproteobacteria bacterium]
MLGQGLNGSVSDEAATQAVVLIGPENLPPVSSETALRRILFKVGEPLKNYASIQALLAELLHNFFEALTPYDYAPSQDAQELHWPPIIMGISVALTAMALIINSRHEKKHPGEHLGAQEYIFSLLSPTFLFFMFQLSSGSNAMSSAWFVGLSATCWIASAICVFTLQLVSVVTCNRFIQINQFKPMRFLDASLAERSINIFRLGLKTSFALAVLFATIDREINGKTEALGAFYFELIALFFIAAGMTTHHYPLTEHPRTTQGYIMLLTFIEQASLTYRTCSGIFDYFIRMGCGGDFCLPERENLFMHVCCVISGLIGLHAAFTTLFNFSETHNNNLKIISYVENAPNKLGEKWGKAKNTVSGCASSTSAAFRFAGEKLSSCCSRVRNSDASENDSSFADAFPNGYHTI